MMRPDGAAVWPCGGMRLDGRRNARKGSHGEYKGWLAGDVEPQFATHLHFYRSSLPARCHSNPYSLLILTMRFSTVLAILSVATVSFAAPAEKRQPLSMSGGDGRGSVVYV